MDNDFLEELIGLFFFSSLMSVHNFMLCVQNILEWIYFPI